MSPSDDEPLARAITADMTEVNVRRVRVLLPVMLVVHAVHLFVYRVPAGARAAFDPRAVPSLDVLERQHELYDSRTRAASGEITVPVAPAHRARGG